jgi:HPt (histidine-containing phosphotransfer) domain-containing protein
LDQILHKYVQGNHKEEARLQRLIRTPCDNETDQSQDVGKDSGNRISSKLLEIFIKDAKKAIQTLSQTLQSKDWKLFATTAHAMKAACANVDQIQLSELAKELEFAAKEEQSSILIEKTPFFLEQLQSFVMQNDLSQGVLSELTEETENTAYLHEKLTAIASACEEYDDATANQLLQELETMPWSTATQTLLSSISEDLLHSDFDEAAAKCLTITANSPTK